MTLTTRLKQRAISRAFRLKMSSGALVITLLSFFIQVNCGRILAVFPTPSVSHQVVFRPITQELARRGHHVVIITTDPAFPKGQTPENLTEIDTHSPSYKKWKEMLLSVLGKNEDLLTQMKSIYTSVAKVFEVQINMKEVKDIIEKKSGEFDLLLTEACARPALGFSHVFRVPLIQISSFGAVSFNDEYVGAYTHPLLFPIPWHQKTYNLTTWDKFLKLWNHWDFKYFFEYKLQNEENRILKAGFGRDIPDLNELKKNIAMLILNLHPLWADNQPVAPNVVYMGGNHNITKKGLSKELQSYLDASKNGVIYFSFGTNVILSALSQDVVQSILKVLSQVPYNVILKWDTDELPISSSNILARKWFPQPDILGHKNVKLFITQGGLQSTDEAIAAGVPLVGVPILADQWYNVDKYVKHKIGVRIDMDSFTEDKFRQAIEKVISDNRYRENTVKLRALMLEQPQVPLERAVWWIEHVLRHGGGHLRPPTAHLSLWDYLEMDLVLLILGLTTSAASLLAVALYLLWKCIGGKAAAKHIKAKQS